MDNKLSSSTFSEQKGVDDTIYHDTKERFIRLPEVKHRTGLARSTIYLYISLGSFPLNRKLGPRSVGWVESEIDEWVKERMKWR